MDSVGPLLEARGKTRERKPGHGRSRLEGSGREPDLCLFVGRQDQCLVLNTFVSDKLIFSCNCVNLCPKDACRQDVVARGREVLRTAKKADTQAVPDHAFEAHRTLMLLSSGLAFG